MDTNKNRIATVKLVEEITNFAKDLDQIDNKLIS